jgi:hypothetical protein
MRSRLGRLLVSTTALAIALLAYFVSPSPASQVCGLACTSFCYSPQQGSETCLNICGQAGYFCIEEDPPCPPDKVGHDCFPPPLP